MAEHELSDEQVNKIAVMAAKIAIEKMQSDLYQQVGKTFLSKLAQLVGVLLVGLGFYLHSKGFFKFEF